MRTEKPELKVDALDAMLLNQPEAPVELPKAVIDLLRACFDGTEGPEFYQGLATGIRLMFLLSLDDAEEKKRFSEIVRGVNGLYREVSIKYLEAIERELSKSTVAK